MKKNATLRGGFFCEGCNTTSSSRFCIDCGKKCIEALPSPTSAPSPINKRIFCTECGIPAPSITTRFCTGCGSSLAAAAAVVLGGPSSSGGGGPNPSPTNALEEEKKRKQAEAELQAQQQLQKAKEEAEQRRLLEEKLRIEKAAEEKRRQAEEAQRLAAEKAKEEEARKLKEEARKLQEEARKKSEEASVLQAAQAAQQRKPQIRFCIECGAKSGVPTAKFCVQCGKTFEDLPTTPTAATPSAVATTTPPAIVITPTVSPPAAAPPPVPVAVSSRSPPPSQPAPRVGVGRKPASATLRGPLRPPCRKCGAPTGPRFCTACGEKTDEELERIRVAGGGAATTPLVSNVPLTTTAPMERDRGHTTVLRGELADAQKELKRQAAEAARNEARANALQAQLEEARRSQSEVTGRVSASMDAEAEATRALRAMLEERERELKRMQELLANPGSQFDEPIGVPDAPAPPPMAPEMPFEPPPSPPAAQPDYLKPRNSASLHDQLKTATLKKAVITSRPKATSSAEGRLRGATFLGAMQRIQAATSKDIDDDDDGDWDED